MQSNLKQEYLLGHLINRMRRTQDLQDILTATVGEVRYFLGTDRVKIYKFNPDESGQVIAESVDNDKLPSLIGLNFPADDIPLDARELFIKLRLRSIVNVDTQQIGQSPLHNSETGEIISEEIRYRPVDSCHVEYLTAMGVQSSLVVPIVDDEKLWGLMVSHHSQARSIPESELELLQMVVDQLSVAIAHSRLLNKVREKSTTEASIKHITALLHLQATAEFQSALEETVALFQASGARLCIRDEAFNIKNATFRSFADCLEANSAHIKLYTCGKQPVMPSQAKYQLFEQYSVWQEHYKTTGNYDVWAISDIYKIPGLRNLQVAFRPIKIRSILIIPLQYRQQLLGYLSIFREEVETQTVWAGEFDPDERQLYPRLSFEVWRESRKPKPCEWTIEEIEMAQKLGKEFALAIEENELYQQVHELNTNLASQIQEHTSKLQQVTEQQQVLFELVGKIREDLNVDKIFQTTTKEICQLLRADRVSIYRFNGDWSGEFVGDVASPEWSNVSNWGDEFLDDFDAVSPEWSNFSKLAINPVWNDTYLQETQGGRYHNNETFAVDDIYKMGFSQYHIEIIEQFQIKAFAIAPILVGKKLWGLLASYQHSQPRHWDASEMKFLSQTANQLGVALQQAELLAQTQKQTVDLQKSTKKQQLLFDVVAKIRGSVDLDIIFQKTTQEVCQLLQADRVSVYRFNADWGGKFIVDFEVVSPEWSNVSQLGINTVWNDTYLQETQGGRYQNNETFGVDDIYQMGFSQCHIDILEQFQIKAFAIAPIFVGKKLWGLLASYQHSQPRHWSSSEIKFLSQAGTQLGVALEQAELLAQTQKQAADLEKAAKKQQLLFDVVAKIGVPLDLETIFQTTTKEILELLQANRVSVYRFNADWGGEFVGNFDAASPEWLNLGKLGINIVWNDSYLQQTQGGRYRNKETFAVDDIYKMGFSQCHIEILEQFQIKAYAIAPIFVGKKLWGLLAAYQHSQPRHWDASEIKFLSQTATQLGVALQQAELLAQIQKQALYLQKLTQKQEILLKMIASQKSAQLPSHDFDNYIDESSFRLES